MNYKGTETAPLWQAIPGYFDFAEVYEAIIPELKDGDYVAEVGCLLGKSVCYLGEAIKRSKKKVMIIAVDSWPEIYVNEGGRTFFEPFTTFCSVIRMAELANMVQPIRGDSAKSSALYKTGQFRFVFIDADHHYDSVKADIKAWYPKVMAGGVIAGHDYSGTYPGVVQAVNEEFKQIKLIGQSWWYRKP